MTAFGGNLIIIGIDPGTRLAGFGVIEGSSHNWRHVEHGVARLPEDQPLAVRLAELQSQLATLWTRYPKAHTVIEQVFLGKNVDSAFKLGHARGVCLMLAAQAGSPVYEYAARSVKKSVTGQGNATKEHVALVVCQLLQVRLTGPFDASDALALALCHAQNSDGAEKLRRLKENQL